MARSAYYPNADRTTQDFSRRYRGSPIQPNVNVLHTTEGTDWPGYDGGSCAPHLTAKPLIAERRFAIRQHFPLTMSSRALRNLSGGVETNTLNCMQLELVGTCDPAHRRSWGSRKAGRDYLFWPEAPDWALQELAEIIAWMHREWAVRLHVPRRWPAYPDSYGNGSHRLTGAQWRRFYGTLGHMHVVENSHGDPGDIDIATVMAHAKRLVGVSRKPRTPNADTVVMLAERALRSRQSKARKEKWEQIRQVARELSSSH